MSGEEGLATAHEVCRTQAHVSYGECNWSRATAVDATERYAARSCWELLTSS